MATRKEIKPAVPTRPGLNTLSPTTHKVDIEDVYRALFGREPEIDSHTGELVHRPGAFATDAAGPEKQR